MEEVQNTIIQYFDLHDGEFFCIQECDDEDSEPTDQILMNRQTAIELAHDILRMMDSV